MSDLVNVYKKCNEFDSFEFNYKRTKINKMNWYIETDNGLKLLQEYQIELLSELYNIFNVGKEPNFKGCNQSGAIYGNWRLTNDLRQVNSMNQICNIFMVYSDSLRNYEFYHINLKTNKVRKIMKKEVNITKQSLRYKPY